MSATKPTTVYLLWCTSIGINEETFEDGPYDVDLTLGGVSLSMEGIIDLIYKNENINDVPVLCFDPDTKEFSIFGKTYEKVDVSTLNSDERREVRCCRHGTCDVFLHYFDNNPTDEDICMSYIVIPCILEGHSVLLPSSDGINEMVLESKRILMAPLIFPRSTKSAMKK